MAKTDISVEVIINDEIMQIIADMMNDFNELADLVPEWNGLERDQLCENISLSLGKILDVKQQKR